MIKYLITVLEDFIENSCKLSVTPAADYLFEICEETEKLQFKRSCHLIFITRLPNCCLFRNKQEGTFKPSFLFDKMSQDTQQRCPEQTGTIPTASKGNHAYKVNPENWRNEYHSLIY